MLNGPTRKRWHVASPVPEEIRVELKEYSPVLQQLLFNRSITTAEQAQRYLTAEGSIYDPFSILDMEKAVFRLIQAIDRKEKIAIYGDYDVDGVTSTALMTQVLKRYGAEVCGYIPNRFDEGYGLTNDALDHLKTLGIQVVLTVDCGIRSTKEALHAQEIGIDLIISDHHHPKEELPDALAIICPKRQGDPYPDKNLASVGLAYKMTEALLSMKPEPFIRLDEWVDLVAVGTVADVVPLVDENRALVRAGLKMLKMGRRQGLLSLAGAANFAIETISARDIGFVLGPRLNAAGRLESALEAYDLLMTDDFQTAGELAQKLDNQNRERQTLTKQMQEQAEKITENTELEELLFAVHDEFNMGVVGLVASRLTDTYYRPTVVGSRGEEFTRASCRSIPEFHITRALDECADLLVRHGGHAMAAGFTVRNENIEALSQRLREIARRELHQQDLRAELKADLEIDLADLRPQILDELEMLEPTGNENPGVLFVSRNVHTKWAKPVGSDKQHLKMTILSDKNVAIDAIAFRMGYWDGNIPDEIDILYSFEKNVFRGRESLQLNIKDLKPSTQPD